MYSRSTYNGTFRIPEQYSGVAFREAKKEQSSSQAERDAVGRLSAIPQSSEPKSAPLPSKKSYSNNIQFQKNHQETERYEDTIEEEVSQPLITDKEEKEVEREKAAQHSFSQANKIKDFFGGDEIIIATLILILLLLL